MKKLLLILILLSFIGCTKKEYGYEEVLKEPVIIKETYKDNNPLVLGIYDESRKLIETYDFSWKKKQDIAWFSIFPIKELELSKENSKLLWKKYWDSNIDKGYKFGVEISYNLNDEKIKLTILKPSDNVYFKNVELYLYDGYNTDAKWISHLEDKDLGDNTVFTSIKLTGGELIESVTSPIVLKVFTYDSSDDFNNNGEYIGNSFHTVLINKL